MDIVNNQSLVRKMVAIQSADIELYQEALRLRTQRKLLSSELLMYELALKKSHSRLKYNSCNESKLNNCSDLCSKKGLHPP